MEVSARPGSLHPDETASGKPGVIQLRHLDNLHTFAERYPDLPIVIDHGAKPDIAGGNTRCWAADMQRLARNTDVCCKLSGLVTEAGPDWRREDILPIIEILLEAFGPRRLMWGSDWPVLLTAGSYAVWRELSLAALSAQTDADRAGILGATAVRFYRLNAEQVP